MSTLESRGGPTYFDPVFGVELCKEAGLTIAEAARLAIRINRLYRRLPPAAYPLISEETLPVWEATILPLFESEGISPRPVKLAKDINNIFTHMVDTSLGGSDCTFLAELSDKFIKTPLWRWRDMLPWSEAHELAHLVQGVECAGARASIKEQSADLMAIEILAALANPRKKFDKNIRTAATRSLLFGLRNMALDTVEMLAIDAGRRELFKALEKEIMTEPWEQEFIWRNDKSWQINPGLHVYIRRFYGEYPFEWIVNARKNRTDRIENLNMPGVTPPNKRPADYFYKGPDSPPLILDDLMTFFIDR